MIDFSRTEEVEVKDGEEENSTMPEKEADHCSKEGKEGSAVLSVVSYPVLRPEEP